MEKTYTVTMVVYVTCEVEASSPEEAEEKIRESAEKYISESFAKHHYEIDVEGDISIEEGE